MAEFILPNIGEGIETVSVSEILIKINQRVIFFLKITLRPTRVN